MMPAPSETTLLGWKNSAPIGNDFEGIFYLLSLDRAGRRNDISVSTFPSIMRRFFDYGWNLNFLAIHYHRPKKKLYTTFF